jgi:DNA-binding beta-propeller fold protein YncE
VQKFSPGGTFLAAFGKSGGDGTSGTGNGEFDRVIGVAVDPTGNIVVADATNNRVQVLSPAGAFLLAFGSHGSGRDSSTTQREWPPTRRATSTWPSAATTA